MTQITHNLPASILEKLTNEEGNEYRKFDKKDTKELLEDFYGERMHKIHKKFPKQVLMVLMKGSGAPGDP